jgi:hypothetical protein
MGLLSKASVRTEPDGLEKKIREYHKENPVFQGMVLVIPPGEKGKEEADFSQKISRAVSSFGLANPLSPKNCLILIPEKMDRELLAHRLLQSLKTQVLYHFQADDPVRALAELRPYL